MSLCTTGDFTRSTDALVYYIEPAEEEMDIAYPTMLLTEYHRLAVAILGLACMRCSVAGLCGGGGHFGDSPPVHRCPLSTEITSSRPEPQCHPGIAGSSKMLRRGTDFQPRVTVCKDIGSGWHIGSPVVLGIQ